MEEKGRNFTDLTGPLRNTSLSTRAVKSGADETRLHVHPTITTTTTKSGRGRLHNTEEESIATQKCTVSTTKASVGLKNLFQTNQKTRTALCHPDNSNFYSYPRSGPVYTRRHPETRETPRARHLRGGLVQRRTRCLVE